MSMEKYNSLQFLTFHCNGVEDVGGQKGLNVNRVPWELRGPLLRWLSLIQDQETNLLIADAPGIVITLVGWKLFVQWLGRAMEDKLAQDEFDYWN